MIHQELPSLGVLVTDIWLGGDAHFHSPEWALYYGAHSLLSFLAHSVVLPWNTCAFQDPLN